MVVIEDAKASEKKRLEEMVEDKNKMIGKLNKQKEFANREFEIMEKNPKVMKPNFAFEAEEAYQVLQVEKWKVKLDDTVQKINFQIGEEAKTIKSIEKDIGEM